MSSVFIVFVLPIIVIIASFITLIIQSRKNQKK
jgi:hypothetical protein